LLTPEENRWWPNATNFEEIARAPIDITYGGWGQDGRSCSSPLMASIGALAVRVSSKTTTPAQCGRIVVASLRKGSRRLRIARWRH